MAAKSTAKTALRNTDPAEKGAASRAGVTSAHRIAMEAGLASSRSLSEVLVIDFQRLLEACAPKAAEIFVIDAKLGITTRMQLAGKQLLDAYGPSELAQFSAHASDTVRGFAAYSTALLPAVSLPDRVHMMQAFADDPHFGVREWAWLALRPSLVAQLSAAITYLQPWTLHESAYIRRFASEALRPRGVWCTHIGAFKAQPALGLPLIEPLRADPSRYVQDSVANWLNDAGKDQPDWVKQTCARWLAASNSSATVYICKRAQRSLLA
jgi:3-methyladenine DNA glycosylase AlkC